MYDLNEDEFKELERQANELHKEMREAMKAEEKRDEEELLQKAIETIDIEHQVIRLLRGTKLSSRSYRNIIQALDNCRNNDERIINTFKVRDDISMEQYVDIFNKHFCGLEDTDIEFITEDEMEI